MSLVSIPNIVGRARDRADYNTRDGVRAGDFTSLAEVLHWLFQRHGHRCDSHVFEPAWRNDTDTYAQSSDSSSERLDTLEPRLAPDRLVDESGTSVYAVQLVVYGENVEIEHALEPDSPIASASFSYTGPGWVRDWLTWDPSSTSAGALVEHWMQARATASDNVARIWQAQIDELVIPDTSWLPTTLF